MNMKPALRPSPPHRRRRFIKRALLIALVLGVVAAIVVAWMPKPVPVDSALVARGPMRVSINEDGQARFRNRYVVSAPLAGSLARIELVSGDQVSQGQTIARVLPAEPPLLDEPTRKAAEARVRAALAAKQQVSAQLERVRAQQEFSKTAGERDQRLFERGAITKQALEESLLRQRASGAELESTRFAQRVLDHEYAMAQATLRPTKKQTDQQPFEVPAPVTGRILKVMKESEGIVQAGTPLLELGDPGALEIVVDVLTSDAVRIRPGFAVIIDRWGGTPLEGRVQRVEPSAFTRLSALGVDEQRVNVRIDLVAPREQWVDLGDGYRVEAQIIVWESSDVVTVPMSAIFRRQDSWSLFVIDGDRARLVSVKIGERTARDVQVIEGVTAGQRVIAHPSDRVADGVRVEVR